MRHSVCAKYTDYLKDKSVQLDNRIILTETVAATGV